MLNNIVLPIGGGVISGRRNIITKTMRALLVSRSACEELGSHHSALKLKRLKKSTTLLGSLREERTQSKPLPPRLERPTGECKESQLTRADSQEEITVGTVD